MSEARVAGERQRTMSTIGTMKTTRMIVFCKGWENEIYYNGLNKNVFLRLTYLNTWSPFGGAVWGSTALLKEICP